MGKEGLSMRLISVNDGKGMLSLTGRNVEIEKITSEDIFEALRLIMEDEDVVVGDIEEIESVLNPAAKIIMNQLWTSFDEVVQSRDAILDEIDSTFLEAEQEYLRIDTDSSESIDN